MNPAEEAFATVKPYRGKKLAEHFGDALFASDADLRRASEGFLKSMATWVFRQLRTRRGKPVPLGEIERFVHQDETKINLTDIVMMYLVGVLRKRGLREFGSGTNSPAFDEMVRAFSRASSQRR